MQRWKRQKRSSENRRSTKGQGTETDKPNRIVHISDFGGKSTVQPRRRYVFIAMLILEMMTTLTKATGR